MCKNISLPTRKYENYPKMTKSKLIGECNTILNAYIV